MDIVEEDKEEEESPRKQTNEIDPREVLLDQQLGENGKVDDNYFAFDEQENMNLQVPKALEPKNRMVNKEKEASALYSDIPMRVEIDWL